METSGRRKARADLAKAHARVAQARAATLHGLTKRLATEFEVVAVEDLAVKNLGAAPAPRPAPDRAGAYLRNGRAAKAGLNRELRDVAFGEIRRQLAYKTAWYGSTLAVAPRFFPSSKTCSACGAVKATLRLAERVYWCPVCDHAQDRDLNAARNIAAAAIITDAREMQESLNAGRARSGAPRPGTSVDAGRPGPQRGVPVTAAEESAAHPQQRARGRLLDDADPDLAVLVRFTRARTAPIHLGEDLGFAGPVHAREDGSAS